MKKRLLSAMLAILLILSVSTTAFAASYSDLEGHWAKEYMYDLSDRGLLGGYSDGTMKPENNITYAETLTFLSRMYSVSATEAAYVKEDLGGFVSEVVPSSYGWAYDSLSVCLAAGIVTKSELRSVSLGNEIQKEQLAVYLIRAMKLTSEAAALEKVELPFDDADKVSSSCHGSVAELVALKITQGNEANNFVPQAKVTRAVAATMISRALDYLDSKGITLTLDEYKGVARLEGVITAVSGSTLDFCCKDGLTREYTVSSTACVTVNGDAGTLSSKHVGSYASISVKNGAVVGVDVDYSSTVKWYIGAVNTKSSGTIYITRSELNKASSFTIPNSAAITRDGNAIYMSAINISSDFAMLEVTSGSVSSVRVSTAATLLNGTVSDISYGSTVVIKLLDSNGVKYVISLDIDELPEIKRGSRTLTIDALKAGSEVTVSLSKGAVSSITLEGSETTLTGKLSSYTASSEGTVWVISTSEGNKSFSVDSNVSVYYGKTLISISDIHVDDQVSVVVYGNTITEIYLLSATSSPTKAHGTVLKVDSSEKQITILTALGKMEYISTASVGYIIDASTGKSVGTSGVSVDSTITAYGSYKDAKNFVAKLIVIE